MSARRTRAASPCGRPFGGEVAVLLELGEPGELLGVAGGPGDRRPRGDGHGLPRARWTAHHGERSADAFAWPLQRPGTCDGPLRRRSRPAGKDSTVPHTRSRGRRTAFRGRCASRSGVRSAPPISCNQAGTFRWAFMPGAPHAVPIFRRPIRRRKTGADHGARRFLPAVAGTNSAADRRTNHRTKVLRGEGFVPQPEKTTPRTLVSKAAFRPGGHRAGAGPVAAPRGGNR